MRVTRKHRIWSGRRVIESGSDSNSSVYTDLQRYGFFWLMPLIADLEKHPGIEPSHSSGRPWEFVFLIDYRKGKNTPPTSAQILVLPRLGRFQITIPLDPSRKLTIEDIEYQIRQYAL